MQQHQSHPHNLLYQNSGGYVIQCTGCASLHIAFGNLSIDQSEKTFQGFMNTISNYCKEYESVNTKCRCIQVLTPYQGFRLLFTKDELYALNDLLQKSWLVLQTEKLVNDPSPEA